MRSKETGESEVGREAGQANSRRRAACPNRWMGQLATRSLKTLPRAQVALPA